MTYDVLQLRAALEREAADVGSAVAVRARLPHPAARRRRLPGWAFAVASVAVVLAVAGTVLLFRPDGSGTAPGEGTIPGLTPVNLPWSTVEPTGGGALDAPAGTPACSVGDLRSESVLTDPTATNGLLVTRIVLRYAGQRGCGIDSRYGLVARLAAAGGAALPNDLVFIAMRQPSRRVLVEPDDLLSAAVTWAWVEGRAATPAAIRLTIDGGPAKLDLPLDVPAASEPGPPGQRLRAGAGIGPISVARPGSLGSLTMTLATPASVGRGNRLEYVLVLTNHTRNTVSLTGGCPDYIEQLHTAKRTAGFHGELPCGAQPEPIEPGASRTFEIALPTGSLPAGPADLRLELRGSLGGTQGRLQVDAPLNEVRATLRITS